MKKVNIYACKFKFISLLWIMLLCGLPLSSSSQEVVKPAEDYILILNDYTEAAPWSNSVITPVMQYISTIKGVTANVEHLNMLMADDDSTMNAIQENLFHKYVQAPKLIILIGNGALIMRDDFQKHWGNVPIILCGEENFIAPNEYYLTKEYIPLEKRTPLNLLAKKYNLTFLKMSAFAPETAILMSEMNPKMKKLIFVADNGYSNSEYEAQITQILRRKLPNVAYKRFTPEDLTLSQLLDSLRETDNETGILYSSWAYKTQTSEGCFSVVGGAYRLLASLPKPVYTLRYAGMDDGGMVGGYMYNEQLFDENLTTTIREILNGRPAGDIPFYYPAGSPVFNYTMTIQKGLSPNDCPSDTVFYSKPLSFWETYKWIIVPVLILLVFGLLFQQNRIRMLRKVKLSKQKEMEISGKYVELVHNMPVVYIKEKAVRNEAGKLIDLLFCDVNPAFERTFYKRADVIGNAGSKVYPHLLNEMLHFANIALQEKRTITYSFYFKNISRSYDIVLSCSTEPDVLDAFCIESTELHQAQQQLSSTNHKLSMALDVANIIPWKWDLQKHMILCDVNKPIELSPMGHVDDEQFSVSDERYFTKIIKEDRARVRQAYNDLSEGKVDRIKEEYRVASKEKNELRIDWVEAQAAVDIRDENGKPLTLVGSSLVITDRKKMEEELISAKDRAEESNRLKSAFLANMSHEIRTPLNAIVGFSSILASTEEESEKKEYISIIENNNAQLLQLVGDILDLSKIEAGAMEFVYTDIELNSMLRELENTLKEKRQSKDVSLVFKSPSTIPCYVNTEKNKLCQVLINLINNGLKFTKEGSVEFSYEIRGKELYFYVKDTGCGMAADKIEGIFERFVKLDSFAPGTGLGLPICKTIVSHLKGDIGVESVVDKGSLFWFTIPYAPSKAPAEPVKEVQTIAVKKEKLTILIAEDNNSNYLLFESILKHDYQLIHAWDGEEAVAMFKESQPHIVLMDINMPVKNGYEATQEIRQMSTKVPIIAVTAYAYTSDEQKAMESGFDGYMSKPINARNLKSQITGLLNERIVFL